jgi:hypothetical protein
MPTTDDDAFRWEGDDDATPATSDAVTLPPGYTAVGRGSETVVEADEKPRMGNVALVSIGILAGVYLFFTLGWLNGGLRLQGTALFLVSPEMYVPALIIAVAAPAIWFLTVFLLTRGAATWLRFVWLAAGVVLLVPWPFIMMGIAR